MSKAAKFSVGDRVIVTGEATGVPYGRVLTVDKVHEEPEPDPIIVKLDRIIELLEQIHIKQVVTPYPTRYPSYPSYPYWGPYWWSGTTSVGAVTGTVINNSTGPTSSSSVPGSDG